ncbi:MAG: hypothetical protein ABR878_02630 [Roseiarcus sp.]|jgi:hypothetical protein
MNFPWFGPTSEEIEVAARVLIVRHGTDAPDEALHLCDVCRSLGAAKNEKLYRLAARKSAILLARAEEVAHWRRDIAAVHTA